MCVMRSKQEPEIDINLQYLFVHMLVYNKQLLAILFKIILPRSSVGIVSDYGLDGPGSNPGG